MHVRFERRVTTGGNLPKTGKPRLDVEAAEILNAIEFEIVQRVRARTDKTHVTANHVDQLRKFVDAETAEPHAGARHARIVLNLEEWALALIRGAAQRGLSFIGAVDHGAELVAAKLLSLPSHTRGGIKGRSRRVE